MINSISNGSHLDLRGVLCPMNYVRCKLALEKLHKSDLLYIHLDKGEPEEMVIPGLRQDGHKVDIISRESSSVKIKIVCQGE